MYSVCEVSTQKRALFPRRKRRRGLIEKLENLRYKKKLLLAIFDLTQIDGTQTTRNCRFGVEGLKGPEPCLSHSGKERGSFQISLVPLDLK